MPYFPLNPRLQFGKATSILPTFFVTGFPRPFKLFLFVFLSSTHACMHAFMQRVCRPKCIEPLASERARERAQAQTNLSCGSFISKLTSSVSLKTPDSKSFLELICQPI